MVRDEEGGTMRRQAPECQKIHLIEQTAENEINPSILSSRGTCGQTKEQHGLNLEVPTLLVVSTVPLYILLPHYLK